MATHIQLKALFLVTLLLGAEAARVKQQINSLQSSASKDVSAANKTAVRSAEPLSVISLGAMLAPNVAYAFQQAGGAAAVAQGWAAHNAAVVAGAAAHNAAFASGWAAHNAAWANLLRAGAQVKGAGVLAAPVITSVTSKTATSAVVVASTRTGLITAAATKAAPWAFLGNPLVAGGLVAANIALTGWQLFKLQKTLKDPTKLCTLLSRIPGTPLSENCIPGAKWGPPIIPPGGGGGGGGWGGLGGFGNKTAAMMEMVDPKVAVAVLAALVLAGGGAWAFHQHIHKQAYDQAFCPLSEWDTSEFSAFKEEDGTAMKLPGGEFLKADVSVGMPRCNGYFYSKVPVDCDVNDIGCRHTACQQTCCDHKGCQAYQFANRDRFRNAPSSWGVIGQKMMGCWLKKDTVAKESDCDLRWFGEMLSRPDSEAAALLEVKDGEWRQEGKLLHQVVGLTKVTPPAVQNAGEVAATAEAREKVERDQCREACFTKDACEFYQYQRKQSSDYTKAAWKGVSTCFLGTKSLDTFKSSEWYGGERFQQDEPEAEAGEEPRLQKAMGGNGRMGRSGCEEGELACPSIGECVSSCKDCEGFGLASNGTCFRNAEQAICDPNSWEDTYNGMPLNDTECSGLSSNGFTRTTIKIENEDEYSGHDLCRAACCADPNCKLYQVEARDSKTRVYRKGQSIRCRLGMVDSHGAPKFKCRKVSGVDEDRVPYDGGYLWSRGCPSGTLGCSVTNDCVANCGQCTGANVPDASGTACTQSAGEDLAKEGEKVIHARTEAVVDDWVQQITPPVGGAGAASDELDDSELISHPLSAEDEPVEDDDASAVDEGEECTNPPCLVPDEGDQETFYVADLQGEEDAAAQAETLTRMGEYRELIVPKGDRSTVCSLITMGAASCKATKDNGGCTCSFYQPQTCLASSTSDVDSHPAFFRDAHHLRPFFTAKGMVLFAGKDCSCTKPSMWQIGKTIHSCTFKMRDELPKVKLTPDDPFALQMTPQ